MTFYSAGLSNPYFKKARAPLSFTKCDIAGNKIWLHRRDAHFINVLKKINQQKISPNENLLIVPYWCTLYPILGREAPLWDIYWLFPETEHRQIEMIKQLKQRNVNWILLSLTALDGDKKRHFSNTHSLLWKHFSDNFDAVKADLPKKTVLLHRKSKND